MSAEMVTPEPEPVPEPVAPAEEPRAVEVWSDDDWRVFEKAAKLAVAKGVIFRLFCVHPECLKHDGSPVMLEMGQDGDKRMLSCRHLDRDLSVADAAARSRMAHAAQRRLKRSGTLG